MEVFHLYLALAINGVRRRMRTRGDEGLNLSIRLGRLAWTERLAGREIGRIFAVVRPKVCFS